jgi:hypothetical protein
MVGVYRRFGGTYCLRLEGGIVSQVSNQQNVTDSAVYTRLAGGLRNIYFDS